MICKTCEVKTNILNCGMCGTCYMDYLDKEDTGPENERGRAWFANDGIDC